MNLLGLPSCQRVQNTVLAEQSYLASRKAVIQAKQDELKAKDDDFCPQPWLLHGLWQQNGNEKNGTDDNDGFDYRGGGIFQ